MSENETVLYFGYGANRDPQMIAAILGRPAKELVGQQAVLEGYRLAIQRLDQVPDTVLPKAPAPISPRALLKECWDDDFKSYVALADPEGKILGTIWEMTRDERERVRDWELVDFGWYVDYEGYAVTAEGARVPIIGERLGDGQTVDHEVDGMDYETWLQDPEKFKIIAEKARREYDERLQGPEGPSNPELRNP